jgi:hypothetical protein
MVKYVHTTEEDMDTATRKLAEKIFQKIEAAGLEPQSYSGRFMFGKTCLGVAVRETGDLTAIGKVPTPHTESLGTGVIAYWPNVPYMPDVIED